MDSTLITAPETAEMTARAEIVRRFSSPDVMTELINKAVRQAIREHKASGNPIATMRDGQVVLIQPEDIEVPEE